MRCAWRAKMIEIKNANKRYGEEILFDNFNISFYEGEINVLMGKSGLGKTTLLRMMMGLEDFQGEITNLPKVANAVFQEERLVEDLSAYKNIALGFRGAEDEEKIISGLRDLDIMDKIHSPCRELSGGMRRRVSVLRAMVPPSDIVYMDEPFDALDRENKDRLIDYILKNRKGRTMVVVLHHEEEARALGARIFNIDS